MGARVEGDEESGQRFCAAGDVENMSSERWEGVQESAVPEEATQVGRGHVIECLDSMGIGHH